jgi:hypothetical protein
MKGLCVVRINSTAVPIHFALINDNLPVRWKLVGALSSTVATGSLLLRYWLLQASNRLKVSKRFVLESFNSVALARGSL